LFVGYSYGSILALKLAKMLENLGKSGQVILIDGSPWSSKKILNEMLPESKDVDERVQEIVMDISLKYAFPNDTSDRKKAVLAEPTWDGKLQKFEELYQDFDLFSKEYCFNAVNLIKNRVMAGYNLSLDDISIIKSPIKLIKPTDSVIITDDEDFGLKAYSDNKIEVTTLEGSHKTIIKHQELVNIINSIY